MNKKRIKWVYLWEINPWNDTCERGLWTQHKGLLYVNKFGQIRGLDTGVFQQKSSAIIALMGWKLEELVAEFTDQAEQLIKYMRKL